MDNISEISAEIDGIASVAEKINTAVTDRYQRLLVLDEERNKILTGPITRQDYIALIWGQIDRKANEYQQAVTRNFRKAITERGSGSYPATVENAIASENRVSGMMPADLRSATGRGDHDMDPLNQLAATYVMQDNLKLAAADAIDAIEPWPWPKAAPMVESVARIKVIDQEMLRIESELELLKADAHRIGLELPGKPVQVKPIEPGSWEWLSKLREGLEMTRRQEDIDDPRRARAIVVKDGVQGWIRFNVATGKDEWVPL
ncbi:hypothetical protein CEE57_06940 [Stenotrophomonas maltophilia]|uniref:hypothetical protein n=1 Tax=Stenotrophomonas maltophilia TaxID=40324 RepID=UPI000B4DA1EA|nr:hypothetical protein [Stenotrophomonas maltophilia]OWQ73574.1 hypothetical protein CEE57_06940 [Stenotrophomonas maltophilia]